MKRTAAENGENFSFFFTTLYRMAFHLAFSPTTKAATKAPFTRRLNNNK